MPLRNRNEVRNEPNSFRVIRQDAAKRPYLLGEAVHVRSSDVHTSRIHEYADEGGLHPGGETKHKHE